jgi:hypothetical protein
VDVRIGAYFARESDTRVTVNGADWLMEANRETATENEAVGIVISFGTRIEAKPRFLWYIWSPAPEPEPEPAVNVA